MSLFEKRAQNVSLPVSLFAELRFVLMAQATRNVAAASKRGNFQLLLAGCVN